MLPLKKKKEKSYGRMMAMWFPDQEVFKKLVYCTKLIYTQLI